MTNQLNKKNFIPSICMLVFSIAFLLLMLAGHSQYALLNDMTFLQTQDSINIRVVLPGVMSIFVIIFLSLNALLSLLSLFMSTLYNFHFINKILRISSIVLSLLESIYFFVGLQGIMDDGRRVIEEGNIVTYVFFVLFEAAFLFCSYRYVEIPFRKILKECKNIPVTEPSAVMKSEEKPVESKEELQKTILSMLQKGKLTAEEADRLLKELHDDNKKP